MLVTTIVKLNNKKKKQYIKERRDLPIGVCECDEERQNLHLFVNEY